MATRAIDILSLDEVKIQLGLQQSETSRDAYLTGLINAAVSAVENETGRTLIDKNATNRFYPDNPYKVVPIIADGVVFTDSDGVIDTTITNSMVSVYYEDYEQQQQSYQCKISRGISPTPFGQDVVIYPPRDKGWEFGIGDTPYGTLHWVNLTLRGPAASDIPAPLKQAALLIVDTLFQGSALDAIPSNNAVKILLNPYKKVILG